MSLGLKKHIFWFLAIFFATLLGANCKEKVQDCTYAYDHNSTEFTWTAFKFTEKVGVSGTFDLVKVAPPAGASSRPLSIKGLAFVIPVEGLNSGKPDRDQKIIKNFFHNLGGSNEIRGEVVSMDAATNEALIEIKLGEKKHRLVAKYEENKQGELIVSATMELSEWGALDALKTLNQACFEEHKGKDGISKLWPDVAIKIKTTPVAECR